MMHTVVENKYAKYGGGGCGGLHTYDSTVYLYYVYVYVNTRIIPSNKFHMQQQHRDALINKINFNVLEEREESGVRRVEGDR